jgi:hypothetical protein
MVCFKTVKPFKLRRLRWAGYVAYVCGVRRGSVLVKKSKGRDLDDTGVDWRIILKCILS